MQNDPIEDRAAVIREGMDVEDADGDKVGTVAAIFQPARVESVAVGGATPTDHEPHLKVHSGLPLIGKTLYVPVSAIRDVTSERVILQIDESDVNEMGWEQRPAWIEE